MAGIDQLPLADKVYDALMVEFMNGVRPPGQRLKIEALAGELGISPTPVREALARLEQTGFVERQARRGYVVARLLDASEMAQLMDARLLMEPTMSQLASQRCDDEFLESLRATIHAMERAGGTAGGESLIECWMADEAFHTLIAERSGNRFMAQAYRSIGGQLQRFRIIGGAGVSHARAACGEHRRVFEALEAGSKDEARDSMATHLVNAKARALADLQRASDRMDGRGDDLSAEG